MITFITQLLALLIGGFVGYMILQAFGHKQRAHTIRFFFFLMIAMLVIDNAGSATARISKDVAEVRGDINTIKQASDKLSSVSNAVGSIPETVEKIPLPSEKSNISLPGRNLWEMITGGKIDYPVKGKVTQEFGNDHHGIDFAVPTGTLVKVARKGKVITAQELPIYGIVIIVDHGNGIKTLYGHLSEIGVKVGQTVFDGDIIGKSGNTGNSTGDHLHFELRVNDMAINPQKYLK